MDNKVQDLMGVSIDKIREMVDANTVIGTPMTLADGTTIIPVSKVSYGFASGGSDLPSKTRNDMFGGGAGAGINIMPVAFLTIKGGDINILPVVSQPDTLDRLVSLIPEAVGKIADLIKKNKED